jgi:hypothetical protein
MPRSVQVVDCVMGIEAHWIGIDRNGHIDRVDADSGETTRGYDGARGDSSARESSASDGRLVTTAGPHDAVCRPSS